MGFGAFSIFEPRSKLLAWRRDIDLGVIVFLVYPIALQIKPHVRIRLSGLALLHGWEILKVLGSSTTLVLEMPRLGSWIVLGYSTTLVLEMLRLAFWLDCARL